MGSHKYRGVALLLLAAALIWGCESSEVLAPSGSTITITATPQTVVIAAGATEGTSLIAAQLFDSTGAFPLEGVDVTFTTSGGKLTASGNACTARLTCEVTNGACSTDADCPTVPVKTDANGVARDELTLNTEDLTPVSVVATSGTATATVSVDKTDSGATAPTADIQVTPPDGQAKNEWVTFAAGASTDPENPADPRITCYQWTLSSETAPAFEEVIQDRLRAVVLRRYTQARSLTVTLRVTSRADAASFCLPNAPAAASFFSSEDAVVYDIVCDLTPPVAQAGPDTVTVERVGGVATVPLSASASDDPQSALTYDWDCGNGQPRQTTEDATCTYTSANVFEVQLRVTNECGQSATDTVSLTVRDP